MKKYENSKTLAIQSLRRFLNEFKRVNPQPQVQSTEEKKPTLDQVLEESNEVLARFRGVWPFDFFPDEVIVDKKAITIVRHWFFGVGQKITCHFEDLVNAEVNVGPFFGSMSIYSKYFTDGQEDVKWFSRGDAKKLHAILQGLLMARKEGVDIKNIPNDELLEKLYKIGTHRGL